MKPIFSRRDFLKLTSAVTLTTLLDSARRFGFQEDTPIQSQDKPNVIIILLDSMSARNLSLYGYPRDTSPNLALLAQRSYVYHRHHAAGNFTTPSTASLLSGVYPWTHRAFQLNGQVKNILVPHNIFNLLGDEYHKVVFAQNQLANILLYQYGPFIDEHIKFGTYNLLDKTIYDNFFPNDVLPAYRSFDQYLFWDDFPGSLYFSHLRTLGIIADYNNQVKKYRFRYPTELPDAGDPPSAFILRPLFDGMKELLGRQHQPFFAYLHLFPPHYPYAPSKEFVGIFEKGWSPVIKKNHVFSDGVDAQRLNNLRMQYDEYIAHTDAELGRLIGYMDETGLFDNSYVIVTSDHGELFERGEHGHNTPLQYEAITQVPLLISTPGQVQRVDVHTHTSNIDILPTILALSGQARPDWSEGEILPGLGQNKSSERVTFTMEAKTNDALKALTSASFVLYNGDYKLIHYRGIANHEDFSELYDLENDPEELNDLYNFKMGVAKELETELFARISAADSLYHR